MSDLASTSPPRPGDLEASPQSHHHYRLPHQSNDSEDAVSVHDALDDILDQYNFHWEPEYRLKLKKELASFSLGIAWAKPYERDARFRLTAKPTDSTPLLGKYVQKLLILPKQDLAALYSKKIAMSIFRLQFAVGFNWATRKFSLDYRINTKWNDGFRFKRKERYQVLDNTLLRCKWNLDMQLPQMGGHLGDLEGSGTSLPALDLDYGQMDFMVTQIDYVLDLDRSAKWNFGRRRDACSDSSSGVEGDEQEGEGVSAARGRRRPWWNPFWRRSGGASTSNAATGAASSNGLVVPSMCKEPCSTSAASASSAGGAVRATPVEPAPAAVRSHNVSVSDHGIVRHDGVVLGKGAEEQQQTVSHVQPPATGVGRGWGAGRGGGSGDAATGNPLEQLMRAWKKTTF